jgi:pimeloyl-[acyl-carrier protein] synthase
MSRASIAELDNDWLTPAFLANPYPLYHRLRSEAPVYWSERLSSWILTRYSDVVAALRDPGRLSNAGRMAALLDKLPETLRANLELLYQHYSVGLIFSDPPDHTRLRALVTKAFTPAVVERMRPRIQTIVNELLDAVESRGTLDVVADFAYPLPATVICEMLGLPQSDRPQFRRWSDDIIGLLGAGADAERAERGQRSLRDLREYYRRLIGERRHHPGEDLISALIQAHEHGQRLGEAELLSTSVTLLTAGQETTTSLIANGLLALLRNPDQLHLLNSNPSLIAQAVEEFLRYDSPVQRQLRLAAEDFELDGHRIRKGQIVSPFLGAANRDPAQFPDPDQLNITRTDNRHTAFGYGIHFCVGAPLARLEAPIAFSTLLRRLPNLRLAGEVPEYKPDVTVRALKALPVAF